MVEQTGDNALQSHEHAQQGPSEQRERSDQGRSRETITYTAPDGQKIEVPIVRVNMSDLFVALRPPHAEPYIMTSPKTEPQVIVDFFTEHVAQVEELRVDMLKRFSKSDSLKCRYQTGDVAYVLGRPFQLRVYPLGSSKQRLKSGMRGRVTSKCSVDNALSLLNLFVYHPNKYDEAKFAFGGYAKGVVAKNATKLAGDFWGLLAPGSEAPKPPLVRLRAMRDRWSSSEGKTIWLSEDIIPYPPDCLAYTLWHELEKRATIPPDQIQASLEQVLPGWRRAQQLLAERAEPYSLQ